MYSCIRLCTALYSAAQKRQQRVRTLGRCPDPVQLCTAVYASVQLCTVCTDVRTLGRCPDPVQLCTALYSCIRLCIDPTALYRSVSSKSEA